MVCTTFPQAQSVFGTAIVVMRKKHGERSARRAPAAVRDQDTWHEFMEDALAPPQVQRDPIDQRCSTHPRWPSQPRPPH